MGLGVSLRCIGLSDKADSLPSHRELIIHSIFGKNNTINMKHYNSPSSSYLIKISSNEMQRGRTKGSLFAVLSINYNLASLCAASF